MKEWLREHIWNTLPEHIFWLLFAAIILVLSGATPEEWIKSLINIAMPSITSVMSINTLSIIVRLVFGLIGICIIVPWYFWPVRRTSRVRAVPPSPPQSAPSIASRERIQKITRQEVGTYGKEAVEAELLQRNWKLANVNQTVKNAPKIDIHAVKEGHSVQIRVTACRPEEPKVLIGGFTPGKPITTNDIAVSDFTIIVRMGKERQDDRFYVMPTAVAWKEIAKRQSERKERGIAEKIGMWSLYFRDRRDGQERGGWGIERKWERYKGAWELLDGLTA
jgi:hypothetical protein